MITIGMFLYMIIHSCSGGGSIGYPLNDIKADRQLIICTDYGLEQTKEIEMHELTHACLHNHFHTFDTKKELEEHIQEVPEQDEEEFTSTTAHCILQAWETFSERNFYITSPSDNSQGSKGSLDVKRSKTRVKGTAQ